MNRFCTSLAMMRCLGKQTKTNHFDSTADRWHSMSVTAQEDLEGQAKWIRPSGTMTNRRPLFHCLAIRNSSTEPRVILWPVKRPYIYPGPVLHTLSANQHLACYDLGIWVPSALRQCKFNMLQLSTSRGGGEGVEDVQLCLFFTSALNAV